MRVTILGAGAMGGALTIPLTEKGNEVRLWATEYDRRVLKLLEEGEEHPRIGVKIPSKVSLFRPEQLEDALEGAEAIIIAVSSEGIKPVLEDVRGLVDAAHKIVAVTKGLIEVGGKILTVTQTIKRLLGNNFKPTYVSGPSIAKEVARKLYTNVVYSCEDMKTVSQIKGAFETPYYRITLSTDVIGAEMCAALKNVYAIAMGILDGLAEAKGSSMENAKATLFLRSVAEMAKVTKALGGMEETAYSLSGISDLLVTIRGGRNGMFGKLLGKGFEVKEALREMARRGVGVIEGYVTAKRGYEMLTESRRLTPSEIPIFYNIYKLLYEDGELSNFLREVFSL